LVVFGSFFGKRIFQEEVMKPRISMITLGVRDMERAVKFYRDGLGLPQLDSPPSVAFFTLNGTWLGLYGWDDLAKDAKISSSGEGFRGVALAHCLASKAEVDRLFAEAIALGARSLKAPEDTFWGGYAGYLSDPDDHLWEIAFNPYMWIGPKDEGQKLD